MGRRLFAFHKRGQSVAQVVLGGGVGVAPVVVDAAFVLERALLPEHEAVRRADRAVGFGCVLAFVTAVGKREGFFVMADLHVLEGILGVALGIVAVNGHELHPFLIKVLCQRNQPVLVRLRVGTVIARKDDADNGILDVLRDDREAVGGGQREPGHGIADVEDGGVVVDGRHGNEECTMNNEQLY